jgi:hypothetical protein
MNDHRNGAARRPKLSLAYGTRRSQLSLPAAPASVLPNHEVRRLVAGMIG